MKENIILQYIYFLRDWKYFYYFNYTIILGYFCFVVIFFRYIYCKKLSPYIYFNTWYKNQNYTL